MVIGNPDPEYKSPPFKILILDEADAMTPDAQSALRKVMEETSNVTRFCLICNYVDKIIEPIISRCMQYRFIPIDNKNMTKRLKFISHIENINISDDIYELITDVVEGDLRKGIMLLQNIKYFTINNSKVDVNDIYDLVGHASNENIRLLVNNCIKKNISGIVNLGEEFYSYGYPIYIICSQIGKIIIENDYINDGIKSNILCKISKVQCLLNDRANEHIQFINLLVYIHDQLKNCDEHIF
jgi:replication factor C subunit 2/4